MKDRKAHFYKKTVILPFVNIINNQKGLIFTHGDYTDILVYVEQNALFMFSNLAVMIDILLFKVFLVYIHVFYTVSLMINTCLTYENCFNSDYLMR